MLNYFITTILVLLLLISQNILLLNEEVLILICFITFCWLALKNLSESFKDDLDKKSNTIEKELKQSLNKTILPLQSMLNIQHRFWNLFFNFKSMGNNCIKFVNSITDWSVNHKIKLSKAPFPKRLQFVFRLEEQASKLISLILIHKLQNVINLKHYYSYNLNNTYFICTNKISIREYLQIIKK